MMLSVTHAELNGIGVPKMRILMEKADLPFPRFVYKENQVF